MNKKKYTLIVIFLISFFIFIITFFQLMAKYNDNKKINNELDNINNISNQQNIINNAGQSSIQINFEKLNKINSDTVGWIKVEGTNINYPIVQTTDNSFYLTHSFYKQYNKAGWVFLDYRNNPNLTDKNTIIYAHSRTNQSMFGSLKNTLTNTWFHNKKNHAIYIATKDHSSTWEIFSVYTIPTTTDYLKINFNNDFSDFTQTIMNRSKFNFGNTLCSTDQILTLSTCYGRNSKLVLHAKLIT